MVFSGDFPPLRFVGGGGAAQIAAATTMIRAILVLLSDPDPLRIRLMAVPKGTNLKGQLEGH